jgi:hypothetical protein
MFRRSTAAILLGSMLAFSQLGCLGQMGLSGKVLAFNLKVANNKWARELVFLLLYIVPVYPFASLIDLIIINSIEFHTGTNPITDKPRIALRAGAQDVIGPDGTRAAATQRADGSVDIRVIDAGGEERGVRLVPVPGGIEAHDADGNVMGRVDSDGTLHHPASSDPNA